MRWTVDTKVILYKANERRYRPDATQKTSRCSVSDADEVVSQFLNDDGGLGLLNRGDIFGNQDGLLRFDEDPTVRPLLSVYAPFVCSKSEVLLTTKLDAVGLGGTGVFESTNDRLLFFRFEVEPFASSPNTSGLT